MTASREDYLKLLYRHEQSGGKVGNTQVAKALGITPASVSEMLAKLGKDGLILYQAYKSTRLTEKGRNKAAQLIRGHRLWEVFLRDHLGYSWSEAHEDAELLEHVMTSRLMERLDAYLNLPAYCPHGEPIPRSNGQQVETRLVPLSQVPVGQRVVLRKMKEERELMDYLEELEIRLNEEVVLKDIGAYEGLISLDLDGKEIQMSYKAAGQILVEEPAEHQ